MGTLGLNRTFAIKNADGTPFHDLVLHKATYDSVVMSLGDKITGDVMYKDNSLAVTMQEYIEYKSNPDDENEEPIRFVLVNPPTVVRDGMASDNGSAKGMTKYSFEFYHPMCALSNFPFTDVAVSSDQEKYLAQNKTFSWIGNGFDMIAKLNKNLQGTQWVVVSSGDEESEAKMQELSDVIPFDNQFVSDALKTFYDTWAVPFVIDSLKEGEYFYVDEHNNRIDYYSIGKRFVIVVGLPSNDIYRSETTDVDVDVYVGAGVYSQATPMHVEAGDIVDITHYTDGVPLILNSGHGVLATEFPYTVEESRDIYIGSGAIKTSVTTVKISQVYVFRFGQGVGLKNNSRTPKNNKIVTRLAGYGSENNIPYGYPQIQWYGNQDWDYTIGNDPTAAGSYPIYKGIVGGRYVKLIKHPFTRKTLMPSVYTQTLFNKVSPYLSDGTANPDYDKDTTIIDYYDADGSYPNPIVLSAPSFEIHQFETIKPELGEVAIQGDAVPYDEDVEGKNTLTWEAFTQVINLLKASSDNEKEKTALQHCYEGVGNQYATQMKESQDGGSYTYSWEMKVVSGKEMYRKVTYQSSDVNFVYTVLSDGASPFVPAWDDSIDDDGNYKQSYFKVTLPILGFDLYACAAITEEMKINMRSGACIGCTFTVMVDWDDYKKNFYKDDGTFDPEPHTQEGDGHVRDASKYPLTNQQSVTLIVQKDNTTFGTIKPNIYEKVKSGDEFVILGISLPQSYVTNAEARLDDAMREYMLENNVYYYDYPLKFDEFFLAKNTDILAQLRNNAVVNFVYGSELPMKLYVKQMTVKYGDKPLPQYDITLTDDVEIVLNKIGQVTDDVSRMRVQISELQKYYSGNIEAEIREKLSRVSDDIAQGRITFQQGLNALASVVLSDEVRSDQYTSGLYGGHGWRIDQLGNAELESLRVRSYLEIVELLVNRMQAQEGDTVFAENDQIDKVQRVGEAPNISYVLSLKEKYAGYVTAQHVGNVIKGIINTVAAKDAGVSDVTTQAGGDYYTSWMYVAQTHTESDSAWSEYDVELDANQIRVCLYGDVETPSQRNFPPCELMTLTRWGNRLSIDDAGLDDAEKARRKKLRSTFYISTSEGRIVKLNDVDKPILSNANYGTTLGELPDFVKRYPVVAARLPEGRDYLYAQGVVVEDFIKIDREGNPLINYVDCGEWVDGSTLQEPTVGHGIYLHEEFNATSGQYETHDVWHNNAKWRCLQHQPYTSEGVTTYVEPTEAHSAFWEKLEEGVKGDDAVTHRCRWRFNGKDGDILTARNDGFVKNQFPLQVTLMKKVGDEAETAITTGTGSVTLTTLVSSGGTSRSVTWQTIQATYDPNETGQLIEQFTNSLMSTACVGLMATFVYEGHSYSFSIGKVSDGAQGERGKKGRFYYYAGVFNVNDNTTLFRVNDSETPYFSYNGNYWVYNPNTNPSGGQITMHDMGTPSSISANWEIMFADFKYIITEALFSEFASLGASVIQGDWMFSRYGTLYRFPFKAELVNGAWTKSNETDVFTDGESIKFAVDETEHVIMPANVQGISDVPPGFYHYKYDTIVGNGRFADGEVWTQGDVVGGQPPYMYFQGIFEENFADSQTQESVYPIFVPSWCVNFKTGAMRMAGGKLRVLDDGTLVSNGYGNKNIQVITAENYGTILGQYYNLGNSDISRFGDIVRFKAIPSNGFNVYLPYFVYNGNVLDYSNKYGTLDDIRSYIGREITFYNDSESGRTLYFWQWSGALSIEAYIGESNTDRQIQNFAGQNLSYGYFYTIKCRSAIQAVSVGASVEYREVVVWECTAYGLTTPQPTPQE